MFWLTRPCPPWAVSTAILLARVVVGVAFVLHGWPKIQNPTGWMNTMGAENPPSGTLQAVAAGIEVGGGALLVIGLLTRVSAVALAAQMIAALVLVHIPHGDQFVAHPGQPSAELACVYLAVTILISAVGPGACSVDTILFDRSSRGRRVTTGRVSADSLPVTSPSRAGVGR